MCLLDTNVVSEWVRPDPDPGVVAWLDDADEDRIFLSIVTLAELRRGVVRLSRGRRRDRLEIWLAGELVERFDGRILDLDARIADCWGRVVAKRDEEGRPFGAMDAWIAATAIVHDLSLVTRNVGDFSSTLSATVNPWVGKGRRG